MSRSASPRQTFLRRAEARERRQRTASLVQSVAEASQFTRQSDGSDWRGVVGGWRPRASGPNDLRQVEIEGARGRARDLIANDPLAGGAIHVNVSSVVGTGLTMKPALDAVALGIDQEQARAWSDDTARRFAMWASSTYADARGRLDFYGLQSLAFRSVLASGDVGVLLPAVDVPGWPYTLAVQLIESDRICNPNRKGNDLNLVDGVVLDAAGRAVGYQVCDRHPGALSGGPALWRREAATGSTGRRRMLLLYEMLRPDQVRGTPYLAPVMAPLKQLSRYSDAELHAAVTAAAMTIFTKMEREAFSELFEDKAQASIVERGLSWDGKVTPGMAVNLLPGESVEIPENKRPNANFDPFFLAIVRQVAVGLELPFEVLIKHFTSSYSASRAALMDAWRTFRRRRDWLAKGFCAPIYEEWLADEIAEGNISAPGFFANPMRRWLFSQATWIGDGPGSIDPVKEVNAAILRVKAGISTLEAESILHDGIGWEQKHVQRTREVEARRAAGLEEDLTVAQEEPQPPQPPEDDSDDEA